MIKSQTSPTLSETLLKKSFWLYFFGYIIAPTGYIIKILVSDQVSVSELGVLYGVISLITLLTAFSDIGMSEMIKYYLPKFREEKKYSEIKSTLTYAFLTQIITGALLAAFFFFWAESIALHYFKSPLAIDTLKVFSLFFLGINVFQIIINFFLALQNTFWYKFLEFVRMVGILTATTLFITQDSTTLSTYASAWIIGLYVGVIFALIIFVKKVKKDPLFSAPLIWSRSLAKGIFSYSILTFLSAQAGIILSQIDMQMIILLLWPQDAGYYSVYLSLIMIPFLLLWPIFPLLMPLFSDLYAKNDLGKLAHLKTFFTKYFALAGLIIGSFLFIFSDYFAYTLFGKDFLPSGIILTYSSMFLIFNFLLQINFSLLSGIWKVKTRLKIILFAILINTLLNFIFIAKFWAAWAALATGIGWLLIYSISELSLKKIVSVQYDWKFLWKNLLFLSIISVCTFGLLQNFSLENISRFYSLWHICFFAFFWGWFFVLINIKEVKLFIWEFKKLRG
jgi:O-antigen/teichoic acid export membrane protein